MFSSRNALNAEEEVAKNSEKPLPGTQVVQSVELPASTSTWNYKKEGINSIGKPRPLDMSKTEIVRYWIYLPRDYETQKNSNGSPLLLFLHGAGERGNTPEEITKVKVHGPPKLLDKPEFNKTFPCVTVSPQCKHDFAWSPPQLILLLDHIEQNYKINKQRIYVTGISMGGFGTWMCLNESPQRFAAAAPICGGAKPEWAEKLVEIPIWNFHGDKDGAIPLSMSQNIVDAIHKAGGEKMIFTIYENGQHDVWTRTYDNQLLFDWLFSHHL
ncbi:MAG: prolyl oligopeptidase family serine peptidase [Planctomycetaceae bacterium]|jgi:predicted peptidase|nr:prolyl oligopeptidase family serine peptidase [Planctomycetaceae bacterium]